MMPALFIGHGSPMNALGDNTYSEYLGNLGKSIPRPTAILSVSAHWETQGTEILDLDQPPTIHDFFGFPPELYKIHYAPPGATELAAKVEALVPGKIHRTKSWGLDHGTWAVLEHLFPKADIPVTQLSLDTRLNYQGHFDLGRALRPLRKEGVLILGSGNIVHNLRDFSWNAVAPAYPWAVQFDAWAKSALEKKEFARLIDFEGADRELVRRAVPRFDHYAPLLYVLGAALDDESISFPFEEIQNGSIAMRSVRTG